MLVKIEARILIFPGTDRHVFKALGGGALGDAPLHKILNTPLPVCQGRIYSKRSGPLFRIHVGPQPRHTKSFPFIP